MKSDAEIIDSARRFYDVRAHETAEEMDGPMPPEMRRWLEDLIETAGRETSVLDAGCGSGRMYPELTEIGFSSYIGVDLSEQLIQLARERYEDIDFRVASITQLEEAVDRKTDVLICSFVFQFVPRTLAKQTLRGMRSVLNDSGVVIFEMYIDGEDTILTHETTEYVPPGHELVVARWEIGELFQLLNDCGFRVCRFLVDYDDGNYFLLMVTPFE